MNYPLRKGIVDYVLNKKTNSLEYAIFDVFFNMPKRIRDMSMNLLGTHDTERILTVLSGASGEGKSNAELRDMRMDDEEYSVAVRRLKLAYTILATLPGLPTIFYGDEAGVQGYSDPFNRRTFPWNNIDGELLSHYTSLGKLRNGNSVYKEGELDVIHIDERLLIFSRFDENDKIITFVNNSNTPMTVYFERKNEELLSGKKTKSISVLPESAIVFSLNQASSFKFN